MYDVLEKPAGKLSWVGAKQGCHVTYIPGGEMQIEGNALAKDDKDKELILRLRFFGRAFELGGMSVSLFCFSLFRLLLWKGKMALEKREYMKIFVLGVDNANLTFV